VIGIWTKRENVERLDRMERRIARLERKPVRSDQELEELGELRTGAAEIRQWLTDVARIEG
jgi:hypothetical protein